MKIRDLFRRKKDSPENRFEKIITSYFKAYPVTRNPVVLAIIHRISSTVSTLGLGLYQRNKTGSYRTNTHPVAMLLDQPNQEDSPTQFLYRMTNSYLSDGNVYIHKIGTVLLNILAFSHLTVTRDPTPPYSKKYGYQGNDFRDADVLHIYNPQYFDGTKGHAIVEYNKELIELHSALLLYIRVYFDNSYGTRVNIELDKETIDGLEDAKIKKEFERWINERIINTMEAGKPVLLKPGMKMNEIKQATNAEAEVASLLERVEKEIANLFGYPYYMLSGDYGNNLQYQQIHYLQSCILPITEIFSEKLATLLAPNDRPFMYFKFSYDNLLMPDADTRHKILREDVRGGLITLNEARAEIDRDLYSGEEEAVGDVLLIMSNLIPALNKHLDLYFANAVKQLKDNLNPQGQDGKTQ